MCRPADRHTDQGQSSQIGVVRAGEGGEGRGGDGGGGFRHGPSDQMEAVGLTAASDLTQAHHPADQEVQEQCGRVNHTDTSVRLS